ncbi:metallophosphoesterase [Algoriphagus halophilus]|uniref:metallophosphoesterase family protein n=1 Tax=Algoriphagus halophilus TaxID=226505 RepID=UPI00358E892E
MSQLGPAAILSLDPNVNFPVSIPEGTDQREWLEATMDSEAWNAAPWKIIVLHQPPYSQGWPGYQGEAAVLDLLEPYFHQGKVDLVIAGHTHDYERLSKEFSGHSVQFLIVGGAGGGLEPEGENSPTPVMDQLIKKHHYGILELDQHSLNLEVVGKGEKYWMHFSSRTKKGNWMRYFPLRQKKRKVDRNYSPFSLLIILRTRL